VVVLGVYIKDCFSNCKSTCRLKHDVDKYLAEAGKCREVSVVDGFIRRRGYHKLGKELKKPNMNPRPYCKGRQCRLSVFEMEALLL